MKKCTRCKIEKPFDNFCRKSKSKDGLDWRCKDCNCNAESSQTKYNRYRHDSIKRNKLFSLTFEQFMTFWQKPCTYCGSEIETIGIDRVDNSIGYELDNCVACCKECNFLKRDLSGILFLELVRRIGLNLNKSLLEFI